MTKTLLAVDDSVTMRKVLEITFSGEDYRVVTAETAQEASSKLGENPQVCVIDTSLGSDDGYALAKDIRKRSPGTAIILLASRYAPYDQAKGKDAGADDWADKPFDTQQLIDKVRKAMTAKEAGGGAAAAPAPIVTPPMPQPMPARSPVQVPSAAAAPPVAPLGGSNLGGPLGGIGRGTQPSLSSAAARTPIAEPAAPPAPPPAPAPLPMGGGRSAGTEATAAAGASAAVGASVNGQMAGKLGELGLTAQQAEAVMALSREVVERVVWEVVPQLAEAIIKEEIARLTRE